MAHNQPANERDTGLKSSEAQAGSGPLLRVYAAVIAAIAVAVRLLVLAKTHSTGEDALITLRYAQNLAHGNGLVFNPGEPVLGVTTPLYCLLLSLFAFFHLPALLCGKLVCIAADGCTCFLICVILARFQRPAAGLFASALYALTTTPISVTVSGMETGLVAFMGLAMVYAAISQRSMLMWGLGAVLYLLRIDGLLLLFFLAAQEMGLTGRIHWKCIALFVLIAAPWSLFAWAHFGTPVPTSLIAKLTVYRHPSFAPHLRFLGLNVTPGNREAFVAQFAAGGVQKLLSVLFVAGSLLAIRGALRRQPIGTLTAPAVWCVVYYLVMFTSRVPAFPWYFLPPWPIFTLIASYAGDTFVRKLGTRLPQARQRSVAAQPILLPAIVALALGIVHLPAVIRQISEAQRIEDTLRQPIGEWLHGQVTGRQRVMLEPIGYIGYYSNACVLDTIGLVSPEVLDSYRNVDLKDPRTDIIHRLRPEWLCLRASEERALLAADIKILSQEYTLEKRFSTPGAEEFAVYRRRAE